MGRRAAVGIVVLVVAACGSSSGDDDELSEPSLTAGATTTVATATTSAPVTTAAVSATSATTASTPSPSSAVPGGWWRPAVGVTWQWQLTGALDLSDPAEVFEIDWETTTVADVDALHAQGKRALCYVSAGSWETFRPDADAFPDEVLGEPLEGWPDERWLDVRRIDLLEPLIGLRFDVCRDKGFDGIEADNVDGYANPSGFDLSGDDQLAYNRMLADLAHERGLAIALKNDLDQIPDLVDTFDLAVNEQCAEFDECDALVPFIDAGKPVLHAEYSFDDLSFCAVTVPLGFSSIVKNIELDAAVRRC